jgi:hypothetical protein
MYYSYFFGVLCLFLLLIDNLGFLICSIYLAKNVHPLRERSEGFRRRWQKPDF